MMQFIWPEVFTNPDFRYAGKKAYEEALSDGLQGWALCYSGAEVPENFGKGMVKIGSAARCNATPEGLDKEYEKWKASQPSVGKVRP